MSDKNNMLERVKNTAKGAKDAARTAANGAKKTKNALNILKNKKLIKKMIIKAVLPVFISILIVVIIASAVFTVFTTIKEKMIELASNTKTAVTGFWKWFTDDYWIKLDEKVEVTAIDDSGRRNNQKYYNC